METIETKAMPKNYSVCIQANCPVAEKCLRHLAYEEQSKTYDSMTVLNPKKCTQDASCPNFRDKEPQRFARGFRNMKEHMYPRQHAAFTDSLTELFGRSSFYRRRGGTYDLTSQEQEIIRKALKEAGVTQELDFDRYVYHVDWRA